ncbi:putative two pore calcium channel protein 1B-like [Capsicum annuum]|nr:putative two pore calcium channel protein 1B-like [Capsicum annuum]
MQLGLRLLLLIGKMEGKVLLGGVNGVFRQESLARAQTQLGLRLLLLLGKIEGINFLWFLKIALSFLEAITKDNPHTIAGNTSRCLDSGNNNSSNSDLTFYEDQNDRDEGMDNFDDVSNYDDNDDYLFYENDDDNDKCDYLSMQAQFDNVDLPAGVEATQLAHVISVVPEKICVVSDIIYVRVCEAKKDLLRAVIIEPQGTSYHNGLFVFDVLFPQNYLDVATMVYYYSGSLRLNPNLYNYGKVCLGLLNTWSGKGYEKWLPKTSSMLQVLVSIQALILDANPFFDEHGYEISYAGCEGKRRSHACHEDAFVLSLKTMTRRPPKVMIVYPGSNFYFI